MHKIRIVSDGRAWTTKILDAETGEPIENVTRVEVTVQHDEMVTARLTFVNVELDIIAEEENDNGGQAK